MDGARGIAPIVLESDVHRLFLIGSQAAEKLALNLSRLFPSTDPFREHSRPAGTIPGFARFRVIPAGRLVSIAFRRRRADGDGPAI